MKRHDERRDDRRAEATQTLGVAGWTLISRITGLARIAVAGATLGPTFFANIFQATNTLPNLTYNLFAGSLVSALVVPSLVESLDRDGPAAARRLGRSLVGVVLIGFGAASALVLCAGPIIVRLITAGVADGSDAADARRQAWVLLLLVVPQIMLYGVAAIGVAAQNARRRFALAAAAPVVENVGLIITLVVAAAWFGSGLRADAITGTYLLVLGIGSTASVAAHAGIQLFGAARVGLPLWPAWNMRDATVHQIVRRGIPTLGNASAHAAWSFGVVVAAGTVPGGVVAIQMGLKLYNLPLALSARAVGTVLMPRLAQLSVRGSVREFRETYLRGLTSTWLVGIPAAVALVLLARPIAQLLTVGELNDANAIALVTAAVASLGLALVGASTYEIARQACFARLDARSPLVGSGVQALIIFTGIGAAVLVFDGTAVVAALGIAITVGSLAQAVIVDRAARRGIPSAEGPARRAFARDAVASIVAIGPAALLAHLVAGVIDGRAGPLAGLALASVVGLVGYALALAGLHAPELAGSRSGQPRRLVPTSGAGGAAP